MTLGEIYSYLLLKLGKDQFGGYVSPTQLNLALKFANIELLNKYIRVFESSKTISGDIYPFVKTFGDNEVPPLEVDSYGYMDLPDDFVREVRAHVYTVENTSCTTAEKLRRMVELMDNDIFNGRITSTGIMLRPRAKNPIATIQNDKLYIQPTGFNKCVFTYLRQPTAPYFDYDIVNGEIVYLPPNSVHTTNDPLPIGTPSLSVELEWPEQVHEDFTDILVKYFAINQQAEFPLKTIDFDKP